MPEPSILLCGPALGAEESASSLQLLRQVTLPQAAKFLITTGKFDAGADAKTVNVEADYPADAAYLQTLLSWAEIRDLSDPRFRDGYDLYCFRRVLARFKKFDHAVLLRDGAREFYTRWPELQQGLDDRLFLTFGDGPLKRAAPSRPSLIISPRDKRTPAFLDTAWELYRTGAVFGMEAYTFDSALSAAVDALQVERILRQPHEPDTSIVAPAAEAEATTEELLIDDKID